MMRFLLLAAIALTISRSAAQDYTVLTYNIRYDNANDGLDRWDLRKEALAIDVMAHKPQLIGLQEALSHQVEFLDQRWGGYTRFGVGRDDGKAKGEFSPVYVDSTVFALVEGRTVWLSPACDMPSKGWDAACERIATLVILRDKSNGDSLWVVNTHWDHVGVEARRQSARMVQEILSPALTRGRRVILMGDLNATANDEPIALLDKWLDDSCPADRANEGTFNGFKLDQTTFKRIDYVWLSPLDWVVLAYDVPHPLTNGRHLSDHFPVVVQLRAKEVRMDTVTLFDSSRNRPIPVAFYSTTAKEGEHQRLAIISHGYNANQPGTYLHYTYLAEHLAANGWSVVSIQHELPTDEPLAMKGNLREARRPNWERGVLSIRFVLEELKRSHPTLDYGHVALIGHSNGGDMSLLLAHEHPALVDRVISLDSRRMPFPRVAAPRIMSLRANEEPAEAGVLPTADEQATYRIRIIPLPNTKHAEMSDRATEAQRREINGLVLEFLNEP